MLMVAMDLATLEQKCFPHSLIQYNRFGFLSLRTRDHFPGSDKSLTENIGEHIPATIKLPLHRVILLSQLAHFGFAFNPISFFIFISVETNEVLGVILEVHNTPWGQRHFYPLFNLQNDGNALVAHFDKKLHVSPFMSMDFTYAFSMAKRGEKTIISLDNWRSQNKHMTAGAALSHHRLERGSIKKAFLRQPLSPHKTVLAIYWQALKLWLKGVPFCPHPKSGILKP